MPTNVGLSTQSLFELGNRARAGNLNTGNLQEEFGTGITPGITASITGNKDVVDVQTNLGTSLTEVGSSSDLLQAQNPFLTQEQSNILKRRRGLAAAGGLFGNAVNAAQQTGTQQFLAQNRVGALGRLQAQTAQSFNQLGNVAGDAFGVLGDITGANALGFDVGEFRPVLQTLADLGYGDEVNALLANRAGQLATTEGGDINQEVFGALQQFIFPQLSGSAQSIVSQEANRLPARFIQPGESAQGVAAARKATREGQIMARALGQTRVAAGGGLSSIIGERLAEFRNSAEQFQLQHSLAQGALARGDFQAVLGADFGFTSPLFQGLGISQGPARGAERGVNQGQLDAATLAARERFSPQFRQRRNATVRSF